MSLIKRRYHTVGEYRLRSLTPLESINLRGAWAKRAAGIKEGDHEGSLQHEERCDVEIVVLTLVDADDKLVHATTDIEILLSDGDKRTIAELSAVAYRHCFIPRDQKEIEANQKKSDGPADSN